MSSFYSVNIDHEKKKVFKSGPAKAIALEAFMTSKAYDLSCRHKIFRTPKLIFYDPNKNIIEFELIDNIAALKSLLPQNNNLSNLLAKAAESLAIIHDELKLDHKDSVHVPDEISSNSGSDVPIHGDFSLRNVQYVLTTNQLVIIDWSFAPRFQVLANFGPRYFDVAFMINSLFSSPPYSLFSRGADRAELAHIFINRYFEVAKDGGDFNLFAKYLRMISELFFQRAQSRTPWPQFLLQRQSRMNFVRFADSL